MTDVVVGLDGSEPSRAALRWAAAVATARGVDVQVVRSWQYSADVPLPWGPRDVPSVNEMDRSVRAEVREIIQHDLGAGAPPVTVSVTRGRPVAALRAAAAHADLLVVGSRGLGGFDGLVLGSVSRQLIEHAPCPVVVVHHVADPVELSTLVVGTDGSEPAHQAMGWAARLADDLGAEVVAVHSLPVATIDPSSLLTPVGSDEVADELDGPWTDGLRRAAVKHRTILTYGDPRLTLDQVADEVAADLVVVGTHGRNRSTTRMLGTVANHLVQYADRPVAVVPPR